MHDKLENQIKKIINKTNILKNLELETKLYNQVPINANMFPNQDLGHNVLNIYCLNTNFNDSIEFNNLCNEIDKIYSLLSELENGIFVEFIFKNCTVSFFNNFNLPKVAFFYFLESNINIYINISNSVKQIEITNSNFRNCIFKNISIFTSIDQIKIDLCDSKIQFFQLIDINLLNKDLNKIRIINSEISNLNIQNVTSEIDIFLSDITTPINEEYLRICLNNSTFNGRFILKDSNLNTILDTESTTFNKEVSFKKLNILSLDFDSTFFNSNSDLSQLNIKNKESITRGTARKIKHILEKDSNKIEANLFHSYELKARKKELDNEPNNLENILDKTIFLFNEKTSNHGLNWLLPIYWMFFIGFYYSAYFYSKNFNFLLSILFWISIISSIYYLVKAQKSLLNKYILSLVPALLFYIIIVYTCNDFGIDSIFKFLNIINFKEDQNISLAENTISKVIMGYLIYQFIISIRKDTRK